MLDAGIGIALSQLATVPELVPDPVLECHPDPALAQVTGSYLVPVVDRVGSR